MNPTFTKQELSTNGDEIAKKILQTGIIKKPLSSYLITGISTKYVDHCVLQASVLAKIRNHYNKLLEETFDEEIYEHYKLHGTSEEIGTTTTESWLLRAHPIPKKKGMFYEKKFQKKNCSILPKNQMTKLKKLKVMFQTNIVCLAMLFSSFEGT